MKNKFHQRRDFIRTTAAAAGLALFNSHRASATETLLAPPPPPPADASSPSTPTESRPSIPVAACASATVDEVAGVVGVVAARCYKFSKVSDLVYLLTKAPWR
jgi:hypothetical protein